MPSDVADRRRQPLIAVMKFAADARRHAVSPGAFDQHAPSQDIAGLGDAASPDGGVGGMFRRHQAKIGDQPPPRPLLSATAKQTVALCTSKRT